MSMSSELVGLLAAASINDSDDVKALQTGAWVAKMGEQYNRQLHTAEKQLAKQLAEKSGGLYTPAQMEEVLRLSSNAEMGVMAGTDMIAGVGGVVKYDDGGTWIDVGNGYSVQLLNHQLDPEMVKFAAANTDGYSWDNQFLGIYPETQTPERPLEFPDCVSCAAGLAYPLHTDTRSQQQAEQDKRALTFGISSLFAGGPLNVGLRVGAAGTAATLSTEALVSAGATAAGQQLVTGEVNLSQVVVAGLLGPLGGIWSIGAGAFGLSTSKELAGLVVVNADGAMSAEQIKSWINNESANLGSSGLSSSLSAGVGYGLGKLPIPGTSIIAPIVGGVVGTVVEEQMKDD